MEGTEKEEISEIAHITAEEMAQFIYEISDKYKKADSAEKAIEGLQGVLRKIIREYMDQRFMKLSYQFGVNL